MTSRPGLRDVMSTNDLEVVRSVIRAYGIKARDRVTGGSLTHMAALNPNAAVMEVVLRAGGSILDVDSMSHSAFDLALVNANDRVLTAMLAGVSPELEFSQGDRRAIGSSFFAFGASTKNLAAVAACRHKELIRQLAKGAIKKSNMPVLECLEERGLFNEDLLSFCLMAAASEFPQLRCTDDAVEWLVRRVDRLSWNAASHIHQDIAQAGIPSWYGWIVLVETGKGWLTTQLALILFSNFGTAELSGIFLLNLAGASMHFGIEPATDNAEARDVMRVLHAGFTPLALLDPFVFSVWRDHSRYALRLVRKRTAEICVALQSLQLPVLLLGEIMLCYYSAWPNVPFHHYWNIGKAVQERYRAKPSLQTD